MSEYRRIKNKITKRHYTGILKGEAVFLLNTIEELIQANKNSPVLHDLNLITESKNGIKPRKSETTKFLPEKF